MSKRSAVIVPRKTIGGTRLFGACGTVADSFGDCGLAAKVCPSDSARAARVRAGRTWELVHLFNGIAVNKTVDN